MGRQKFRETRSAYGLGGRCYAISKLCSYIYSPTYARSPPSGAMPCGIGTGGRRYAPRTPATESLRSVDPSGAMGSECSIR